MDPNKKGHLVRELAALDKLGAGSMPRGTYSSLAKKYDIAPNSVKEIHLKLRGEFTGRNPEANFNRDPIKEENSSSIVIKNTLYKLEGSIQGLSPFHPRLATYMMEQVNLLFRYLYVQDQGDATKLTIKSKEGWEDIDKEALKNTIVDNRIMNQEPQQEELESIEKEGLSPEVRN